MTRWFTFDSVYRSRSKVKVIRQSSSQNLLTDARYDVTHFRLLVEF